MKIGTEALKTGLAYQKKRLKKLSFRLKAKIFLTVILPGAAALLALETVKTFLRINLRETAARVQPEDAPIRPEPVILPMEQPEFVTPQPVKSQIIWQSKKQKP